MWLAAVLLTVSEFLVFDQMTSRFHAHVYPRWTDQTQYLSDVYSGYENLRVNGFWHGLKTTLTNPVPQGKLHDVLAVLIFRLTGNPSRSAALSLNILAFLAWQAALFAIIPRVSGSRVLGWMGFGLLLCLKWPWSVNAGSAVDFRLDHSAMCFMGMSATVALLTKGYRSWGWSMAFGAAVGLTLVERFLTGTYFALIFVASVIWVLVGESRFLRLRNLLLAGLAAGVLAAPIFWLNRLGIYNYYWGGHILSADGAARTPGLDTWRSVVFVFSHLGRQQLGAYFGWTVVALTVPLLVAISGAWRKAASPDDRNWLFFGLAFLLLPAVVLCLHRQKSEFVLGILVPGVVLLILWIWAALWRRIDFPTKNLGLTPIPALFAVGAVAAGGGYFLQRQLAPPHSKQFLAGARQINQLADYLFTTSRTAGLAQPRIGVDQLTDSLDGRTMSVFCYERQKTWLPFSTLLPTGILMEKDDFIMDRLKQCDFVLLTDQMAGDGYYPYDHQMRRLYPILKQWCETHLRRVETFPLFDREMSLYQRREIP
jgi:hypothetical protein